MRNGRAQKGSRASDILIIGAERREKVKMKG